MTGMKRMMLVLLPVVMLSACQAPKPWSPYDSNTDKSGHEPTADQTTTAPKEPALDIGDAEQGIYIEAHLTKESLAGNVKAQEAKERRKLVQQIVADVSPPLPSEFWIEYTIRCTRNFKGQPVVLQAAVMVNGKPIDTIEAVLGAGAMKNTFVKKVNLLAGLTPPPASLLAAVEGKLTLMPPGTAEENLDVEKATSEMVSRALDSTIVRVNFAGGEPTPANGSSSLQSEAPTSAPTEAPASASAETPVPAPTEAPAPAPAQ